MTSIREGRCKHCGISYQYAISGGERSNANQDYCHGCQTAIFEALKKVPVKYKREWVDTKEIGMNEINAYQAKLEEDRKTKLVAQRVFPGLVNMSTGEYQKSECIIHNGVNYHCMWWGSKGEDSLVVKKQEWVKVEQDELTCADERKNKMDKTIEQEIDVAKDSARIITDENGDRFVEFVVRAKLISEDRGSELFIDGQAIRYTEGGYLRICNLEELKILVD